VTTGSHVDKDEWLATLSAPEIRSPIQGYLVARELFERAKKDSESSASIELARSGLQQATERLLTLGISSTQIEEITRTRQVPTSIDILAPAAGFVLARNISVGQKFSRGDELFRIADLSRVWVLADAFGAEAEHMLPGAAAEISIPGRARTLRGRVSRDVPPQFDAASQSVKLRLDADNPGYVLRPEMFVDVDLPVTLPPAIAVPVDAIIDSGLTRTVFVERRAGVFEPREVETGWRFGGRVEVVKGLAAGERVVIAGTFVLDAQRRIQAGTAGEQARP
jgi:RND family efflux transporter MFP subunit